MNETLDALVVGLGAVGSAAAWRLAQRGLRVVGIDAYAPPHALGSSHGALRITRKAIGEGEAYVPLVLRANALWRELERETGASLLGVTGGLWISSPARQAETHVANFFDNTLAAAARHGIEHEILDAPAMRARFPQFAVRDNEIGYYEPDAGYLRPEACISAQLQMATRRGAELRTHERVTHYHEEGGVVSVFTDRAAYRTRSLVLAAGPWIRHLVEPRLAALFTVTRQVQYWFETGDAQDFTAPRFPVWIWELQDRRNVIYGFPRVEGAPAGVKIATEQYAQGTTPERMERGVSGEEMRAMHAELVAPYLPGVTSRCLSAEACLYTATPDFHFLIDRLPGAHQVWLASACSGHGFKHSAAVGELVAAAVCEEPIELPRSAFALSRFGDRLRPTSQSAA
jgi:sarcosine oxidase